tara:strand:- start:264 stop:1106 length:843 start_codon:yes stop_codon:yes gene_type:complete
MEKTSLTEIKSDIKYKRDSLHLAHEELKQQGDFWNKIIIFVSLGSSLFESTKMKMGWNEPALELFPIILSSIVAAISALIKFKRYNEQQEVLIQSCTVLTSTLAKARNCTEVDDDLLREYHDALELLETSLYPDVRKRFLRASQKNLVSIISNENDYFKLIEKAKSGQDISAYRSDNSSSAGEHSDENIKRFQMDLEQGPSGNENKDANTDADADWNLVDANTKDETSSASKDDQTKDDKAADDKAADDKAADDKEADDETKADDKEADDETKVPVTTTL